MNRLFVTGDVHGSLANGKQLSSEAFPAGKTLDRDDFVFIAGDFGCIWNNVPNAEEAYHLNWLSNKPWTTFVIGGNHENWPRLHALPREEAFGVSLGVIRPNVWFVPNGTVLTIAGSRIFVMGGAMSTDKMHRTQGVSWWPEEIPSVNEMNFGIDNLEKCNWEVDYVITHTMPTDDIAIFRDVMGVPWHWEKDRETDPTAKYLQHIAELLKYKKWYCGHFHVEQQFKYAHCLYKSVVRLNEV